MISGCRIRSKVVHYGDVVPIIQPQELPAHLCGCLREVFRALRILGPLFKLDTAAVRPSGEGHRSLDDAGRADVSGRSRASLGVQQAGAGPRCRRDSVVAAHG